MENNNLSPLKYFLLITMVVFSIMALTDKDPHMTSIYITIIVLDFITGILYFVLTPSDENGEETNTEETNENDIMHKQIITTDTPAIIKMSSKHSLIECPNCGASIKNNTKQCAYCDTYFWV